MNSISLNTNRKRNYFAGLVTGYLVTIVTIFVGLWLTPFSLRYLDREQYAVFTLSSDIISWLTLLDLGISAGLNVQVAQQTGKPDQEKINILASTTFYSQLLLVGIILLLGIGIASVFPAFISVRPDLRSPSLFTILLMVLGLGISLGTRTFSVLLVAHQQVYMDNLIRLGLILIRTTITVLLLIKGFGIISTALANLSATIITCLLAVWRAYRLLPGLQIRRSLFSGDVFKKTLGLGIWFSLGGLAGLVILNLDRLVTAKIISLAVVTTLSLTGRLYSLSNSFLDQITNTARPMLGQLFGQGRREEVFKLYRRLFTISTGGAVIVGSALWCANRTFIEWWVGGEYYGGIGLDIALAINLLVNCWVLPNRATLSSAMVVKPQTLSRLVEGAVNFSLSLLLGLKFGVIGILLGTSIASLLTSFWYLPYLTAKLFNRSIIALLINDFLKIILLFALLIYPAWLMRNMNIPVIGLIGAMLKFALMSIIGIILLWFIGIDREFKGQLIYQIKAILNRFKKTTLISNFIAK